VITVPFGELVAALYDETEKLTRERRLQTLLVALALLDLRRRVIKSTPFENCKKKNVAA
jgi:hypothetical protein